MQRWILGLLSVALFASLAATAVPCEEKARGLDALAWLAGSWRSETGGARAEENWTEPLGATMLATARQVKGGKTAFFEFLRVEEREGGKLVYVAMPMGRKAVEFPATKVDERSVLFENPAHDSPKRILYRLDGETLVTRVDDGPEDKGGFEVRYARAR